MTKKQISDKDMCIVLRSYLNGEAPDVFDTMPMMAVWFALFGDLLNQLLDLSTEQGMNRKGAAELKADRHARLLEWGLELAAKMRSYATATSNPTLYNVVNYLRGSMTRYNNTDFIDALRIIRNNVTILQPLMIDYGITALIVTGFTDLLEDYETSAPAPRISRDQKRAATLAIKAKLKAMKAILKDMDGAALGLMISNKTFFTNYFLSRVVNKQPTRAIVIRGKIVDEQGNVLPETIIKCVALGIHRRVSKKGSFLVHTAPDNLYTFEIVSPGYETQTITIRVHLGQRSDVVIVMQLHA